GDIGLMAHLRCPCVGSTGHGLGPPVFPSWTVRTRSPREAHAGLLHRNTLRWTKDPPRLARSVTETDRFVYPNLKRPVFLFHLARETGRVEGLAQRRQARSRGAGSRGSTARRAKRFKRLPAREGARGPPSVRRTLRR